MPCNKTTVEDLARQVKEMIDLVSSMHQDLDTYRIHIYLQEEGREDIGMESEHAHWGVFADQSYGGSERAWEVVNAALPARVYCLVYESSYENVHAAFDAAYNATF